MSLDRHFKQGPMFGCCDPECCGVYPPEDVDHCPECMVEWPCDVELLRQRAERAEQTIREMAADALTREAQYEELERAELARDKWRRQALAEQDNHMAWRARAERAERLMRGKNLSIAAYRAALDRVRALADEMDAAQRPGHKSPTAARIRAALEGDQ